MFQRILKYALYLAVFASIGGCSNCGAAYAGDGYLEKVNALVPLMGEDYTKSRDNLIGWKGRLAAYFVTGDSVEEMQHQIVRARSIDLNCWASYMKKLDLLADRDRLGQVRLFTDEFFAGDNQPGSFPMGFPKDILAPLLLEYLWKTMPAKSPRWHAFWVLGDYGLIGDPRSVPILFSIALRSKDRAYIQLLILSCYRLGGEQAEEYIAKKVEEHRGTLVEEVYKAVRMQSTEYIKSAGNIARCNDFTKSVYDASRRRDVGLGRTFHNWDDWTEEVTDNITWGWYRGSACSTKYSTILSSLKIDIFSKVATDNSDRQKCRTIVFGDGWTTDPDLVALYEHLLWRERALLSEGCQLAMLEYLAISKDRMAPWICLEVLSDSNNESVCSAAISSIQALKNSKFEEEFAALRKDGKYANENCARLFQLLKAEQR